VEAPVDETGPTILHSPVSVARRLDDITINAIITDPSLVAEATVYFRQPGADSFLASEMAEDDTDRWSAVIPGFAVSGTGIEY